jgi:Transposase DDE domain
LDEDVASELITAVAVRPANEHDAVAAAELVAGQEAAVGLRPAALLGDGAYGTGDARAALAALGVEVVAKLPPLQNGGRFSKEAFTIDLAANDGAGAVTCPAGQTTTTCTWRRDERDRRIRLFHFPAPVCAACPLRAQCLRPQPVPGAGAPPPRAVGRTITLHFHEALLQQARAAQRTPAQRRALRDRLRPRAKVERKFAELMRRHGLRQARSIGMRKTDLQAVLTVTVVNVKRILALAATAEGLSTALPRALTALATPFRSLVRGTSHTDGRQDRPSPLNRRGYCLPLLTKSAAS